MIRMPVPSVLDRWNGSSRATRHLLIRARSASGLGARGGHVTSSGSPPRVRRRPARTFVLPTPRCPRWAHHNPLPCGRGGHQGAEIIMPDNGFIEALNGLFQGAQRKPRGYTRFATMRTVLFLIAGKLDFTRINLHAA